MFFEREVEFFGMSMSTGREMMAWYIRVVLILCEVGQLQVRYISFQDSLFFFPYCNFRQNQSRLLRGHGPACHIRFLVFLLFIKPPVFLPRITIID